MKELIVSYRLATAQSESVVLTSGSRERVLRGVRTGAVGIPAVSRTAQE